MFPHFCTASNFKRTDESGFRFASRFTMAILDKALLDSSRQSIVINRKSVSNKYVMALTDLFYFVIVLHRSWNFIMSN